MQALLDLLRGLGEALAPQAAPVPVRADDEDRKEVLRPGKGKRETSR
ncbi:MAG: hypothetical protein QNJ09_08340 [Paracoccaceae bacterium]|nr:hypothetical protein [Paracoccaceae bacterium]